MKKLLLVIALFVSVNVSAQSIIRSNSMSDILVADNEGKIVGVIKEKVIKLHKVSYYHETLGNKSAESKARKETVANYKKLGYAFDGMITNSKGKFMKFVK